YMAIHPPMLYLGYVGLTIPFALAMGALLSGRVDERWIVATRRWTLAAWAFLGVGQLLGAHWAYVEIGWGGYYAWDPVENAALMPWLAATAFLHSVMIQQKRGMLKVWNMVLVALAFCLSIFGTFLTRSGVVNSIHSFSQSPLVAWRRASLRALGRTFLLPLAAAGATGAILIVLGFGSSTPGLLAYTFGTFVAASIVLEFVRGTRATGSLLRLVGRNRRRYGGYLVHAAIVLLAIGIAGSSAYQTVRERGLKPGGSLEAAGYTFTYRGLSRRQEANAQAVRATVDVSRGGSHVVTLHPGKNSYPVEQQVSNEVSIYHDPRNLGDV